MKLTKELLKKLIKEEIQEAKYGGKSYRRPNLNPMNQQSDSYAPKGDYKNPPRQPRDYSEDFSFLPGMKGVITPAVNAVLDSTFYGSALPRGIDIKLKTIADNPGMSLEEIAQKLSDDFNNSEFVRFAGKTTPERQLSLHRGLLAKLVDAMRK